MSESKRNMVRLSIEVVGGTIQVEVDPGAAPITAANFLSYVDLGLYDGGRFHRTVTMDNQPLNDVKIEVVQGGVNPSRMTEVGAPIPLERTSQTGLRHTDGVLSMGRVAPDSAQSEFFICIGDQPELDFNGGRNPDGQGFAAFGRVTSGMDIVREIQRAPQRDQALIPPVIIRRILRIE